MEIQASPPRPFEDDVGFTAFQLHDAVKHPNERRPWSNLGLLGHDGAHSLLFQKKMNELDTKLAPPGSPVLPGSDQSQPTTPSSSPDPDRQLALSLSALLAGAQATNGPGALEMRWEFLRGTLKHLNRVERFLRPHGGEYSGVTGEWKADPNTPPDYSDIGITVSYLFTRASSQAERVEVQEIVRQYAAHLRNQRIIFDLEVSVGFYAEALSLAQAWLAESRTVKADHRNLDWREWNRNEMMAYDEKRKRRDAVGTVARLINIMRGLRARAEFLTAEYEQYEKDYLLVSPVDESKAPGAIRIQNDPVKGDLDLGLAAALNWFAVGEADRGKKILSHIHESTRYYMKVRMVAAWRLAQLEAATGNPQGALELYREVSEKSPELAPFVLREMNVVRSYPDANFLGSAWYPHLLPQPELSINERPPTPPPKLGPIEAFRSDPERAPEAFQADPEAARAILDKEFPALIADTYEVRWNVAQVIIQYHLTRHFPVLFPCITDGIPDTRAARPKIMLSLSQAITSSDPPELRASFEKAIVDYIHMAVYPNERARQGEAGQALGFQPGRTTSWSPNFVPAVSEVALKRHLQAGIEGVTMGFTQFTPAKLKLLRGYIELPTDDEQAMAFLREKPVEFKWLTQ